MSRGSVNVVKLNGGLGRNAPTEDVISGLVVGGISTSKTVNGVTNTLALGTSYKFQSLRDMAAYGLTADTDSINTMLFFYHCKEFFRKNPNGTLWLMAVARTVTLTQMADIANSYAAKLIKDAGGTIKQIGLARNPATGTPTITGGLDNDVNTALPKAQALADDAAAKGRELVVLVEGRSFSGTVSALTDNNTLTYPNVAIVLGQDLAAAGTDTYLAAHAAVGTALGDVSAASVNDNIGWVEKFPLQNKTTGDWLHAGLSSNIAIESYEADLDSLDTKGYIFPVYYPANSALPSAPGYYWNGDPTCTSVAGDFARIRYNRTWNKASRLVRDKMTPKINSTQEVDPVTGYLPEEVVKYFEGLAFEALNPMSANKEYSGADVYIDPKQNLISSDDLKIEISITPTGSTKTITASIGFTNPFK
jgi:hypothetical protein